MANMSNPPPTPRQGKDKGVFASLFDTTLEHFITPTLLQVGYTIVLALTVIAGVGLTISGLAQGYLPAVLLSPLGALLFLLFVRVVFEGAALFFALAADVKKIRERGVGL